MIPRFFIDRPVFAWVIAIAIVLGGLLSLRQLPVAQYPEVAPPSLTVTAIYPGANSQVLEETVTTLIEQEMNGLERLLYLESASDSSGTMTLNLTFSTGTNLDIASVETQNRIKRVEARLPEEVRRQGITVAKSRRNYLMFATVYSPDNSFDGTALGSFTNGNVIDNIRRVKGVGEAQLFGSDYAMRIWLDPYKLTGFGLTPGDVLRAIRSQNAQLATGELGQTPSAPGQQINAPIVVPSRLKNPDEFANVILRAGNDGTTVRLKDVARVELGAQTYAIKARFNGQPTAAIGIKLAPTGNAIETAKAVRTEMEEMAKHFPKGISWDIPYDTSKFVEISIKEVIKTLIEAMLLVFLVMYIFLQNFRVTLIPAIVVPVALLGAMIGLHLFGYSINVLTLFAMVLAIGIVVDDAIVVVENVERIMVEEKLKPRDATYKAMGQIFGAIVGITVVLSAVFIPMAFFAGSTGAIYRQFAVTLVLTMLFSALMAISLTPALCSTLLKPHDAMDEIKRHKGFFGKFNNFFSRTTDRYQSGVEKILKRVGFFLLIYLAIVLATGWLFIRMPSGFLPEEDQGYVISIIQLPSGATQERTLEVLSQVEQYYLKQPEVEKVVGVGGFSFFGPGQNAAIAFVRLKGWDDRTDKNLHSVSIAQRANMMMFMVKQAFIFTVNPPPIPELASVGGFDFRLQDRSAIGRDQLLEIRNMVLGMASQDKRLMGVRPEGQEPSTQLLLDIDRIKARSLGVDLNELNETLQIALGSAYVNDFLRQGRVLRVVMQSDTSAVATPSKILNLRVRNASGNLIPIGEFAAARWSVGSPKLDRYNGVPSMKLAGSPGPGYSTGDAMNAMEDIAKKLPPGVGFEWSGTSYEERQSGAQAPLLFGLSLIVVFLCLAALYEAWSIPLAVMLVVPLGIFGAVLAVMLRGMPNDVYFKVGLIAIIGLSAKNAILIIEFARHLHAEGKDLVQATLEACRLRFRPILMTSIAFMFGVLPLAISSGAGASSRHAIGTGVMGGMIAATVLAVYFVPVLFVAVLRVFRPKEAEDHTETTPDPDRRIIPVRGA